MLGMSRGICGDLLRITRMNKSVFWVQYVRKDTGVEAIT